MRLAGTYHPIEYLLLRLEEFFPTLEHLGALFYREDDLHFILNGDMQEIQALDQVNIQKIRSKRSYNVEWTQSANVLDSPVYSKQNSLYDEEKNTTLLVYIPSIKTDFSDVIILTFPKNQVMKGVNNVFSGLSTTDKSLIGAFVLNVLKSEYVRIQSETRIIDGFSKVQKRQLQKMDELTSSLEETKRLYLSSLRVLIDEFFEKMSRDYNCKFTPSDDLIDKVAQLQMGIEEIYLNLRNAIELGYHLLFGEREIQIPASYLTIEVNHPVKTASHTNLSDKVASLLDRYEESALILQSKSLAINGKNVAKFLDPPVTPPAITDAVKKNEKRIRFLLNQYGDKWQLIRRYLKPIERINDKYQSSYNKAI